MPADRRTTRSVAVVAVPVALDVKEEGLAGGVSARGGGGHDQGVLARRQQEQDEPSVGHPGLRIGYLVAPAAVIARITELRVSTDLQGDQAHECAVAELFEDGDLVRHVRRMRRVYRSRRDALVEALRAHLGAAVHVSPPAGGMALWVRTDPDVDLDRWSEHGVEHGVGFLAGRRYAFDGGPVHAVRLGFTPLDEQELDEAARRMAAALREVAARTPRPKI